MQSPNAVHQADLLFLPHDKPTPRSRKVYKYASTVVGIASRFKAAEPLTSKDSLEVSKAFQNIYSIGPLRWPKVLQVDPDREFMGEVTKEMEKYDLRIRRGNKNVHRDQGLSKRFFSYQYSQEMNFASGDRSREWVKRLQKLFLL